jgi:hypothetical protein
MTNGKQIIRKQLWKFPLAVAQKYPDAKREKAVGVKRTFAYAVMTTAKRNAADGCFSVTAQTLQAGAARNLNNLSGNKIGLPASKKQKTIGNILRLRNAAQRVA